MPPPTAPTVLPGSQRSFAPGGVGRAPKRVARLMRAHRIAGFRPRRPKRATTPARSTVKLPDLVGRRFGVGAPDRAWVSDITYVRTGQGWLYLAVVLDLGSRRLLGYAMSERIDARARRRRARHGRRRPPRPNRRDRVPAPTAAANTSPGASARPPPDADSPSQRAKWGPQQTTPWPRRSSPGLKRELVHRRRYPDRATARRSIFEWLARYNTTRRHTSLDNLTPDQHEQQYRQPTGNQPALSA